MRLPWISLLCADVFTIWIPLRAAADPADLNVMTFNLRYDNPAALHGKPPVVLTGDLNSEERETML